MQKRVLEFRAVLLCAAIIFSLLAQVAYAYPPTGDVTPSPPASPSPATPTPQPTGPIQDAVATYWVAPEIPDALKTARFKASVHVRVGIRADGGFTTNLTTSSGNAEIDRCVLNALRQWRWKPALQNGTAVDSAKLFRFDFEVN